MRTFASARADAAIVLTHENRFINNMMKISEEVSPHQLMLEHRQIIVCPPPVYVCVHMCNRQFILFVYYISLNRLIISPGKNREISS